MKIAVLSDTRLPTNPAYTGHGLGQIVHAVASGLSRKGHTVTLFAGHDSAFDGGELITATDERGFLQHDLTRYDAVMDNTHGKVTRAIKGLPALQVSHDREARPSACAVYPSEFHRSLVGGGVGEVVYNGVALPEIDEDWKPRNHVVYMSTFYPAKGANAAWQASQMAGIPCKFAGTTPPAPPPGSDYVGPLSGVDKVRFFAEAKTLIFPSAIEAGPVTVLEAQAAGCPVIVSPFGGASENMADGMTGYIAGDVDAIVDALAVIDQIDRVECRAWIARNRSQQRMIDAYEGLLQRVANGERW